MAEDTLQLCPVDKWSELEDVFNADWPRSVTGVILLQMQRYILQHDLDHGCKVYCPYGDGRHGLVAVNIKTDMYEVLVQCPKDDTSKLEAALKATNIIDWDKVMEIPFVPKHVVDCIERVIKNKNVVTNTTPAIPFILEKTSSLFNVTLPSGFRFDLLSLEHVDLINSTWRHNFKGSDLYFKFIIKAKLGYGLFKENQLISWVLVRETGALLHLYTLPEERRKGYGELVLKLTSNVLLKEGRHVVAFGTIDNVNAFKLYQKLNFQQATTDIVWCSLINKS